MSNDMRQEYRTLSQADKETMLLVKDLGQQFFDLCQSLGTSRELSLAQTKVQEAVMWAVNHITK